MTPFAIGCLQLELRNDGKNVERINARIDALMALYPWVQMVVTSELAATGPLPVHAQRLPGPAEKSFAATAKRHGIWLIPGSLFERVGTEVYNTAPVIDPSGHVVARYRKMFPFRPYEHGVAAGDEFVVFDVPEVGRFGVSICYDMWFPETSRTLALLGAEVIIHPTMTPTIDREVELSIARATAAQQQCYVIDVNGAGDGGNGQTIVVGPHGDVLHQSGRVHDAFGIEIDLDVVRRTREVGLRGLGQTLKSFRDREVQFDVYAPDARSELLDSLGPLSVPAKGSRAGLPTAGTDDLLPDEPPDHERTEDDTTDDRG